MASPRLPVLWFCGASGVGKSTVAWQVLLDLAREGVRAAYVDIDQLGMVYPPPDGDPDRNGLKTANLRAVIPSYAEAGARVLVVSGVADPDQVRLFSEVADTVEVTFCHVIVEEPVLRRRLAARGWSPADGDEAVEEMRTLQRAGLVSTTLDTTNGAPAELAAQARRLIRPVPAPTIRPPVQPSGPGGVITVVCGPRAVGKSSVSWALFTRRTAAGERTCYLDLDQISVLRGGGATDRGRRGTRTWLRCGPPPSRAGPPPSSPTGRSPTTTTSPACVTRCTRRRSTSSSCRPARRPSGSASAGVTAGPRPGLPATTSRALHRTTSAACCRKRSTRNAGCRRRC